MTPNTAAVAINSPFALMFPDAVQAILDRAEHMNLPRKRYSPLSKPVPWGRAKSDLADFDASIEADDILAADEADIPAFEGRCEPAEPDDDFDARA